MSGLLSIAGNDQGFVVVAHVVHGAGQFCLKGRVRCRIHKLTSSIYRLTYRVDGILASWTRLIFL